MEVDTKLLLSSKPTIDYTDFKKEENTLGLSFNFLTNIQYQNFAFNIKVTQDEIEVIPSYTRDEHKIGAVFNVYQKIKDLSSNNFKNYPTTRLFYEYNKDSIKSVVKYNLNSDIIDAKVSYIAEIDNIPSSITIGYVPELELTTFDLSIDFTEIFPDRYISDADKLTFNMESAYFADENVAINYTGGIKNLLPYYRPLRRFVGTTFTKSNTIQTNNHVDFCTDSKGLQIFIKDIFTRSTSIFFDKNSRVEYVSSNFKNNSASSI